MAIGHRSGRKRLDACHREAADFPTCIRAAYGFRVVTPSGTVGTVQGHVYDPDGRLAGLTVACGFLRRTTIELSLDEVDWVLPYGRRVVVRAGAA